MCVEGQLTLKMAVEGWSVSGQSLVGVALRGGLVVIVITDSTQMSSGGNGGGQSSEYNRPDHWSSRACSSVGLSSHLQVLPIGSWPVCIYVYVCSIRWANEEGTPLMILPTTTRG